MKNNFICHLSNLSTFNYGVNEIFVKRIEDYLIQNKGKKIKVLDFGCSRKPYKYLFDKFDNVIEYIGIDVYAGEFVDIVYDGEIVPFEDQYFDIIFSSSVLEHVEDLDYSLEELHRVLKIGGYSIHSVPFLHHAHGTPFDFNRLTYFGWMSKFKSKYSDISINNTDGRLCCIMNVITSQINFIVIDVIKLLLSKFTKPTKKSIVKGDASPENSKANKIAIMYFFLKLNPINFVLGLVCWMSNVFPKRQNREGEITSAFVIELNK